MPIGIQADLDNQDTFGWSQRVPYYAGSTVDIYLQAYYYLLRNSTTYF